MRHRSAFILSSVLALTLTGCATPAMVAGGADAAGEPRPAQPSEASDSSAIATPGSTDPEAQAQAHAWLDAAALPSGAIPADASVATFSSYTGWPCGPVVELEGFWSIPDATVSATANWLRDNPTADLISTSVGAVPDDPAIQSAIVGYIPAEGAQEGVVYTVEKSTGGVAVRAEVAAQTAEASCPVLPDGGQYGAPGQG